MNQVKLHGKITEEADNALEGKHIGALFDLDKTLLASFSAGAFTMGRMRSGQVTRGEILANIKAMADFIKGERDFSGMVATTTAALEGLSEDSFEELAEQIYKKKLAASIYPEARALVKAHQRKGHTLAIVSAATRYQIEPVARELGIEHILCTRYEVKNGLFTGKVQRPTCWGEGKAHHARQLAASEGLDLGKSYFYTDAHQDLPLLDIVGKPRPLNPDAELAEMAAEREWPVVRFNPAAKPGVSQVLRNGLVFAALLPSAAVGLPLRMLTGSTKKAADAAMSTWTELSCAAIGLELNVQGREHLWSHRPAVFIYNHQSAADGMIVPRLLERDYVGIAKKEIATVPVFGAISRAVGTVFVDRAGTPGAPPNLQPAVDALRNGLSIILAPEGTRSYSSKMGPFKKGAFHLAMQAGVPIVPIVIHNSLDVSPKGSVVYRSARVEVEVLPPISTNSWRVETINQHVHDVRSLFLERLDHDAEPAPAVKSSPGKKVKTPKKRVASGKATTKRTAPKKAAKGKVQPKNSAEKKSASKKKVASKKGR